MFFLARRGHAPRFLGTLISWPRTVAFLKSLVVGGPASTTPRGSKRPVTPIFAVLLAMVFAVLAFLQIPAAGSVRNAIAQDTNAEQVSVVPDSCFWSYFMHILRTGILLVV